MSIFAGLAGITIAILGGYLWEGGHLHLLNQPAEFVIIGGAGVGILIISTPVHVIKALVGQLKRLLTAPPSHHEYQELLVMLYQLFRVVQSTGVMALESHFDNPAQS